MLKDLLIRQLNHELLVAAQAAYFSAVAGTPSLKEHFLGYAQEELRHFSGVITILHELGHDADLTSFQLNLETDELKALIILEAMEDTMIHYYEDLHAQLSEPLKSIIKAQLEEERRHKGQLNLLLRKVKKDFGKEPV